MTVTDREQPAPSPAFAPSTVPWWRPDRMEARAPYLQGRARAVRATRACFDRLGLLEVETPALQASPGLEPHLKAFETELEKLNPSGRVPLYLHTSPEFAMKKLLAGGLPRIWQMARVFRNGERSTTHHPEFTMIEWYRAHEGYRVLIEDCKALLRAVLDVQPGRDKLAWAGHEADPHGAWEVLTVAEAVERHAGIDLFATIPEPDHPDTEALRAAAAGLGVVTAGDDDWDAIFFRIFLDRIEPKLGIGAPTVLIDYPVHMAALSRPSPADPRVAERFELYVCGLELANAFGELTDTAEQRRRFEADMDVKERLYGHRYPIDEDFMAALEHGLPESAGIALGFDRLVMLATGASHVEQVLWAPVTPA